MISCILYFVTHAISIEAVSTPTKQTQALNQHQLSWKYVKYINMYFFFSSIKKFHR